MRLLSFLFFFGGGGWYEHLDMKVGGPRGTRVSQLCKVVGCDTDLLRRLTTGMLVRRINVSKRKKKKKGIHAARVPNRYHWTPRYFNSHLNATFFFSFFRM